MKALTVRQPWAWAIIHGGKDVENRSQRTNYRGKVAVHAGLSYAKESENYDVMQSAWTGAAAALPHERGNMGPLRKADLFLDYGQVIGTVEIVGCHHVSDCNTLQFTYCSKWAQEDCWHWELADAKPLTCPFPAKGKLGLWNLSDEAAMP